MIVQQGTAEEILANPANDYVAKFVEDVDMTKVITAEAVMKKSETVAHLRTDGPKAALHKMQKAGISSIFVSEQGRVVGIVTARACRKAADRGEKSLANILDREICKVLPNAQAAELFTMLGGPKNYPIAVVNEDDHLLGVIVAGLLLAKLAETYQGESDGSADGQD